MLPRALSIDEFKGNAVIGKYQCILFNLVRHQVLDILHDRSQNHLTDYFKSISCWERLRLEFFVCDMWQPYTELAKMYSSNANFLKERFYEICQNPKYTE
ncbi:MAG: transposase [Lachnospiraceae bacterium]|nr:transposase [Lachnospiraceae bacterium]MDD7377937.1 transposase [Lachnospiraceae bacterium]MDY4617987.1 transposase [Lachnospiraceae bacterium]